MNIKELRIGNLIERNGVLSTIEIINNELDEVYFLGEDFYYSDFCCNIEPIHLTGEWLQKFGSKPRFQNTEFIYNRFRIVFKESYGYWDVIDNYSLAYITKVEFVHELQNLIFTLTGDDLKLAE